jgi:hypothetical protein
VNAAALWALAASPGTPKNVQIHVVAPPGLAGTNSTTLTWKANPEPNLAGYLVVTRETTSPDWTNEIDVGSVTTVTLDIAKDNVQFGVRAVDNVGNRNRTWYLLSYGTEDASDATDSRQTGNR